MAKPQGGRIPGKYKHRWENNIETHLKRTGFQRVTRIHLTPERRERRAIVSMVKHSLWLP